MTIWPYDLSISCLHQSLCHLYHALTSFQASILPPFHHPFSPSFLFLTKARRWMAIQPLASLSHVIEPRMSFMSSGFFILILFPISSFFFFPSRFNGENGNEKRNSFQRLQMNSSFFTSIRLLFPNLLPSSKFLWETREVKRREVNES